MSKSERRSQALVQLDQEHAVRDGISEKVAVQLRLEGESRITNLLILDNYLEWLKEKTLPIFPDTELLPVNALSSEYPFKSGLFNYSPSVLLAAFSREYWRLYVEETDIEADLTSVLGVPPRLFAKLSTLRLSLVRKYHIPSHRK